MISEGFLGGFLGAEHDLYLVATQGTDHDNR